MLINFTHETLFVIIVCSDSKEVIERIKNEITSDRAICARIEEVPALFEKTRLNADVSPI